MKNLLIIFIALICFSGISQTQYEKGMQKALDLWNTEKPSEAINLFERIAIAEPDEWLPPYYASLINVLNGFGEKDEAKLTAQQEKAMEFLINAKAISKDNAELLLLEALWYTVWVAYDGAQYGMKYGAKVSQIYQEAFALSPNSPRVILNKAEWDMGGARFFGQPITPFCKDIKRAIELFADFKPEGKFYPSYGLERAKQVLVENCNN